MNNVKQDILKNIGKERYKHSIRVANTAKKLSEHYNIDNNKGYIAGILHDCAKYIDNDRIIIESKEIGLLRDEIYKYNIQLLHAPLGYYVAKQKYNIKDEDILNSIKYHTTGRKNMSNLEKIIFISDYIEPKRNFKGINRIRELAYLNLDKAMIEILNNNIKYLIKENIIISKKSIEARNYLMISTCKGE